MLTNARILLIVTGGIAAYKALELIRLLRKEHCDVTCVLTAGGAHFVTPLSLQALSEQRVYTDLFSLTDESEMGHIQLSRSADLVVVAPASADILAKMAAGLTDDLASTVLLATDKRVLIAPAMNVRMWLHPATQANMATLSARGIVVVGPDEGAMACNEFGPGRLAEPPAILAAITALLRPATPLAGKHALVTSGPTHEPIDPVRYIANRSSGRQGHAIAGALAALGARVTLVSGPVEIADPPGVTVRRVETAADMLDACEAALPADIAVCAAAVADWRVANARDHKIKKQPGAATPGLELVVNPDILARLSRPGRCARPWWSDLPPRPTTSRTTPRPSAPARDATGSSPTTSRPPPVSWGASGERGPAGHRCGYRDLAPDGQGGGGRTPRASDRRGAGVTREIAVMRLPHAADLPLPAYASAGAAGMDLLAAVVDPVTVLPGERVLIPTGLVIALPPGHELQVRPRSGLALKHGIVLPNSPGTIDEDYRGEVRVILMNAGTEPFLVERGMRVAQAVLAPVVRAEWVLTNTLDDTVRGSRGFGSTGTGKSE